MAAVSSRKSLLLLALRDHILVHDITHYTQVPKLRARLKPPALAQGSDEINALTLDPSPQGEEILVAVYDSGMTIAWSLGDGFPVLWTRNNGISTWGCATSPATGMVATSANSHKIHVLRPQQQSSSDDGALQCQVECQDLEGHENNVPSVAFSEAGAYLASASIDGTIRLWSLDRGEAIFCFRYTQWCWSVRFVCPYYFWPAAGTTERANSSSGEESAFEEPLGSSDQASESSSQGDEAQERAGTHPVARGLPALSIDHGHDVQNGYTATSPTDSAGATDLADAAAGSLAGRGTGAVWPDGTSLLLLCSTERDLLLIDPERPSAPIVDKIGRVVARTALATLIEMMAFDRVTFLVWIPELAIAVAGSLSGTAALVRLTSELGCDPPRHRMRLLGRVPEEPPGCPLYGVSVYRQREESAHTATVILYLIYLDGRIIAYELRSSLDATETYEE
ncbi:hypothetical protein GGF46_003793 [Coemansia sp. RSA 552]|nr:hypothetical protein GGF46_003793 [Coemansia sp. RSA 552]